MEAEDARSEVGLFPPLLNHFFSFLRHFPQFQEWVWFDAEWDEIIPPVENLTCGEDCISWRDGQKRDGPDRPRGRHG
jgi:hypothetical protein